MGMSDTKDNPEASAEPESKGGVPVAQWIPVLVILLLGLAVSQQVFIPVGDLAQRFLRPGAYAAASECRDSFLGNMEDVAHWRVLRRGTVRSVPGGYQVEDLLVALSDSDGQEIAWQVSCGTNAQGEVLTIRHSQYVR
jgi:hypothetical protein